METLVEQPVIERARSFDPLASVRMMQYDIAEFGHVLPETRTRIYDEELSFLAEGVDRAARTTFVLQRQGEDIVYFSKGQWRPYIGTLLTGQTVARAEASADPRCQFLADKADEDLHRGYMMQKMQAGERMRWYSAYPDEVEAIYGASFLQSKGFLPHRRMGFLYQATCEIDGSIILESQTVDRSDPKAFAAAAQAADLNGMVDLYDAEISKKYGDTFYAGRLGAEQDENAWSAIRAEKGLIEYFLNGLERLAYAPGQGLEDRVKRHVYGVWALFKKRIDGEKPTVRTESVFGFNVNYELPIAAQVQDAFRQFVSEGRQLIGCGGAIEILQGLEGVMKANSEDVFESIFGERKLGEDKYGSLQFKCPKKGCLNTRRPGKLIENCQKCGADVRC